MRVVHVPTALAVLAAVLLFAGCGGDGDGEATTTRAGTTTTGATTTGTTTTVTTAARGRTVVTATLTGEAASPKGAQDGGGTASIVLDPRKGTACWTLSVSGIDRPLSAHIHDTRSGQGRQVVIPLGDTFSRKGCVLSGARALRAVAQAPGSYSVDVHTQKHLQGAVSGQLRAAADA